MNQAKRKAVMVFNDGSYFEGSGFGATKEVSGEFVFNTGMVGYPESMTDPSYYGQILIYTYPLIGNYGVPDPDSRDKWNIPSFFESDGLNSKPTEKPTPYNELEDPKFIKTKGIVVHEHCEIPSHWRCKLTLDEWMKKEGIPGIEGVDTREITKKLRTQGVKLGILKVCEADEEPEIEQLIQKAKHVKDPNLEDLASQVSIKEPIIYNNTGKRVVLLDVGVKLNIVRKLLSKNLEVIRVPHDFKPEEILEFKPSGFFVSNGPGDPKLCDQAIKTTQYLIESDLPFMGICLGNQIFALALGGDTYKLLYGHRSQNQPALDLKSGKCYITNQNHGFAPDKKSLEGTELEISFINANDNTVEGLVHKSKKAFSIQFHPENYPGAMDTEYLFEEYKKSVEK